MSAKTAPFRAERVQDSMPTPHGQTPLGNCACGHCLASGKASLSGWVTTCDHQVSVLSAETPILSFQGISAGPKGGDTGRSGFGDEQCCLILRYLWALHLLGWQLTMQPLGAFNSISFIHSDKRLRTACFSKDWALLFSPQEKWKHKIGLSTPHLSSTHKLPNDYSSSFSLPWGLRYFVCNASVAVWVSAIGCGAHRRQSPAKKPDCANPELRATSLPALLSWI